MDGAHAGTAALLPELRHHFDGLELADSYDINPHKCGLQVECCGRWEGLQPYMAALSCRLTSRIWHALHLSLSTCRALLQAASL